VSSTATLECGHYVALSDQLADAGPDGRGIPEDDDLEGARDALKTGYGQTKWVSERLLMEAGRRGLKGHIVRPGYVVGDSQSAGTLLHTTPQHNSIIDIYYSVTNTDDFLWRLVKGCIQLGLVPDINNSINMVPVDHVARIVSLAAVFPLSSSSASASESRGLEPINHALTVLHVTARPPPSYNDLFSALGKYGYEVTKCEYIVWRRRLEQHVLSSSSSTPDPHQSQTTEDANALFPLLHFVLDDLPTSTKAPELRDTRTRALLRQAQENDSATVGGSLVGLYLAWLIEAGFLPVPSVEEPEMKLPEVQKARAVGRSGV
jgi:L-2-aminoadipate reductase